MLEITYKQHLPFFTCIASQLLILCDTNTTAPRFLKFWTFATRQCRNFLPFTCFGGKDIGGKNGQKTKIFFISVGALIWSITTHMHIQNFCILLTNLQKCLLKYFFWFKVNQKIIYRKTKLHFDALQVFFLNISACWSTKYWNLLFTLWYFM